MFFNSLLHFKEILTWQFAFLFTFFFLFFFHFLCSLYAYFLFVTYSRHLFLHGLLIHHLPTFCHLLPSPSSSWPTRSSLVCFLIAYFHHLLPCNLLVHHLPIFSSLACIVSSLFVACLRCLLIAYLHHLFITFVCHLLVAYPCCIFIIYLHRMLAPCSFVCHMLKYPLNMLFLAHYLLVTCFLSHPFFLHDTTPLLACVGSKVRNNEANYNSSHLPLK